MNPFNPLEEPLSLEAIAQEACENYTHGSCMDEGSGRTPNAPYGAYRYCAPCRVRHALGRPPVVDRLGPLRQAMTEYAEAIRGDWSTFDGRTGQDVIESWVAEIRNPKVTSVEEWRDRLGICPDGNGHWAGLRWGHCTEKDCPTQLKRETR